MNQHWIIASFCVILTSLPLVTGSAECSQQLDVAIVGAGPGGAYSAYSLRHAAKHIGLFEYSDRVGGRIYDYKLSNTPDVNLPLGAMRYIPGSMAKLEKIIDELGLHATNFTEGFGREGRTRHFLRGQSFSKKEISNANVPYNLNSQEKQNQHRLLEYYLEELVEEYQGGSVSRKDLMTFKIKDGRYLYQLSFEEAIGLIASPEGIAFVKDKTSIKSINEFRASAAFTFHDLLGDEFFGDGVYTLKEGMMAVAKGLVDEFIKTSQAHFLKKNMQLRKISKKSINNYMLEFKPTETKLAETQALEFKDTVRVCAHKVILALPVYALRQVDWTPLRDDRVEEAFNAVFNTPVSKIFMTFPKPWWRRKYNDAFVHFGDWTSVGNAMYDFKRSETSGDHILLISYRSGNQTEYQRYLQNTGTKIKGSAPGVHRVTGALARTLMKELAKALNISPNFIPRPKTATAQFWAGYPFGSGWITFKPGYNFDELIRLMRKPSIKDDVFVVGSDYSWGVQAGWIEGALQTVDTVMDEYFWYEWM